MSLERAPLAQEMASHPLFAGVCSQTPDANRAAFTRQNVRRSSVIFDQGEEASAVFLVLRGCVALNRIAPCGREIAPALLGPGSIAGADALTDLGGYRSARAVGLADATGLLVTATELMRIVASDGSVASNLIRILCLQHEATVATLEELATLNVVERIARFLGRLTVPGEGQSNTMLRVGLPLTHQEIAAFVSSSRETVSLAMGQLARAGRIARDRHGYAVRCEPEESAIRSAISAAPLAC